MNQQNRGGTLSAGSRIEEGFAAVLTPGNVEGARDPLRECDFGVGWTTPLEAAHLDRSQQGDYERHQRNDGDDAAHGAMEAARVREVNAGAGTIVAVGFVAGR
jgi:hypothetical protein